VRGQAYAITLFTANSVAFALNIPVAAETATPTSATLLSFTLIGLYVGVIPVFLGIFWFPALKRMGRQWMTFLMALTAGLLIFLGIDASSEALELAQTVGGPFQGVGLVGIGIVSTFMLLDAIARRQTRVKRSEAEQRLAVAFMIALGIGLHNLGEGLAIGASFSVGAAALGTFLVIGFIIQNITEGLGIIAPVLKDSPSIGNLAAMGLVGGAPAIAGAWLGGLTYSQPLAVLFLAIGAGAVFEVVYEIAKLIQQDVAKQPAPLTVFAGLTAGMLLLYVTGLLIK
jgi:zinc transporter ZupT